MTDEHTKGMILELIAPLIERIEALEEKINWVTVTDWAAIGRQHRAPSSISRPQRDTL